MPPCVGAVARGSHLVIWHPHVHLWLPHGSGLERGPGKRRAGAGCGRGARQWRRSAVAQRRRQQLQDHKKRHKVSTLPADARLQPGLRSRACRCPRRWGAQRRPPPVRRRQCPAAAAQTLACASLCAEMLVLSHLPMRFGEKRWRRRAGPGLRQLEDGGGGAGFCPNKLERRLKVLETAMCWGVSPVMHAVPPIPNATGSAMPPRWPRCCGVREVREPALWRFGAALESHSTLCLA
jgi:hypothetical protein